MSNYEDFVNMFQKANAANASVTKILGNTIEGLLADLAGGIGAVSALIDLMNQQGPTLQDVIDTIDAGFAKLNLELQGQSLKQEWADFDQWIVPAESVLANLPLILAAQPRPDSGWIIGQIETCLNAVDALSKDDKWLFTKGFQMYLQGISTLFLDVSSRRSAPPRGIRNNIDTLRTG